MHHQAVAAVAVEQPECPFLALEGEVVGHPYLAWGVEAGHQNLAWVEEVAEM